MRRFRGVGAARRAIYPLLFARERPARRPRRGLLRADLSGQGVFLGKASGKLARRPELDKALLVARRRGDHLVVMKIDRFGWSLEHLIDLSPEMQERGVDLVAFEQGMALKATWARAASARPHPEELRPSRDDQDSCERIEQGGLGEGIVCGGVGNEDWYRHCRAYLLPDTADATFRRRGRAGQGLERHSVFGRAPYPLQRGPSVAEVAAVLTIVGGATMGEEPKVKTAEGEVIVVRPDPLSGSATTFTIYHGGFDGDPPKEGALEKFGLGHLSEGHYVQPAPGTQVTFPPRSGGVPKPPPPTVYLAICSQEHAPDAPGVDANGNWSSGILDDCQAAFAAAASHEHAVDRVEAIRGPVGVAITSC